MRSNGADPHQVLGVARDATVEEIKRAYRALAKRHHPDAGDGSVTRFLEIQAAYEALVGGDGRRERRPGTSRGWGAGRRQAQPGAGGADDAAPGSSWARRPPGTRPGRAGMSGAGGRPRPDAGDRTEAAGPRGREAPGGRRPAGPRRATLGSTSYDDAEEVFEPGWSGASWYGPSSGTYWTVNPKEYADPRKHGPEYLARARRRGGPAGGAASAGGGATRAAGPPAEEVPGDVSRESDPGDPTAGARRRDRSDAGAEHAEHHHRGSTASPRPDADRGAPRPDADRREPRARPPFSEVPRSWRAGGWSAAAPGAEAARQPFHHEPAPPPGDAHAPAGEPVAGVGPPEAAETVPPDRVAGSRPGRPAGGPGFPWRVTLALAGWLAPGLALAAAAGLPGGIAATLPLQVAGIAVLALAPRAAWAATGGGVTLVLAAVPIVALVAALGGSFVPGSPAPAPAILLGALAWAAGCAMPALGRVAPYPWRQHA